MAASLFRVAFVEFDHGTFGLAAGARTGTRRQGKSIARIVAIGQRVRSTIDLGWRSSCHVTESEEHNFVVARILWKFAMGHCLYLSE
jgi:hypothetical protein